ncbi:chromatin remodeling factor [Chloropicon primus]|uniref:Chromatin remodeling factor n=2 Tax=Chloropicon primus TaxID=1764295 RepID=A0A5B8MU67_9CHLO|nr:chromatin remodeling factor [Chloropicon primus]|eukprot:QDZ23866.1 chromatin remodeling factor [Chloropicon primus]
MRTRRSKRGGGGSSTTSDSSSGDSRVNPGRKTRASAARGKGASSSRGGGRRGSPSSGRGRGGYAELPTSDEEDYYTSSESESLGTTTTESSGEKETDYTDIQQILSSRQTQEGEDGGYKRELQVRWKDLSYLHTTWEPEAEVERACARKEEGYSRAQISLRSKLKSFREKNGKGKGEDPGSAFAMGFDPDFITVERVIGRKFNKNTEVEQFYVKWKGLPYGEATWEEVEFCRQKGVGFEAALKAWRERKPIYELAKGVLGTRKKDPFSLCKFGSIKKRSAFQKYEATPDFLKIGDDKNELYAYQLEGLNWLEFSWQTGQNVILGDEMGLGKTVQALSLVASLVSRGCARPHLVVAPLSTILNWQREAEQWAPHLNVVNYSGNAEDRKVIYKHEFASAHAVGKKVPLSRRVKVHLILTTYEMVLQGGSELGKLEYGSMIIDEGHRLKNRASKLFGALTRFSCEQRVILTGTPLQNNLEELFMLMHFIDPKKFSYNQVDEFLEDFSDISTEDQIEELHKLLKPHLLRRMKRDVLKQLPPKKEQIVLVEMSHEQKDVYKALLMENFQLLSSKSKTKVSGLKNLLMDLRKCCQHPSLITKNFNTLSKRRIETFTKRSGKLELLERMLEKLFKGGHRVLIYSQFVLVLDMVQEWLEIKGIEPLLLDGSVKGKERQKAVDTFNSDKDGKYSVFLLSTKAGGLGINLATADTVIIFDSDWNPHNDIQAQARAHRLGQSKEVMIYRLVTRATVEERMVEVAKRKMVLEHLVVSKGGKEQTMKQEEIDDVLKYGVSELFQKEEDCSSPEAAGKDGFKGQGKSTTAQREIDAGREGGNKGKGVYYDDAALDKLLDRRLAWEQGDDDDEQKVKESQHLQAFKVANFEIQEGNFWEDVFQDMPKEAATEEELGKGKREKRRLDQAVVDWMNEAPSPKRGRGGGSTSEDQPKGMYDQEYDPSSSEESSTEEEEESGESKAKGAVKKDAGVLPHRPLSDGAIEDFQNLKTFSKSERKRYYSTLMRFGFDEQDEYRNFLYALPAKSADEVEAYKVFFMKYLMMNEDEFEYSEAHTTFVKESIHVDGNREAIATRIADLHLIKLKVEESKNNAREGGDVKRTHVFDLVPFRPNAGLAEAGWTPEHDVSVLEGVLKHGYGSWKSIAEDETLMYVELMSKLVPDPRMRPNWIMCRVRRHAKKLRASYSRDKGLRKARAALGQAEEEDDEPVIVHEKTAGGNTNIAGAASKDDDDGGDDDNDCVIVSESVRLPPASATGGGGGGGHPIGSLLPQTPTMAFRPLNVSTVPFSLPMFSLPPYGGAGQPLMNPVQQMMSYQSNLRQLAGQTGGGALAGLSALNGNALIMDINQMIRNGNQANSGAAGGETTTATATATPPLSNAYLSPPFNAFNAQRQL